VVGVLRMAYRNLVKRKLRFSLTAAGIAVGVALILSLLSMTATAEQSALQSIRRIAGYDIAIVNSTIRGSLTLPGRQSTTTQRLLSESIAETVLAIQGVYAVTPTLSIRGSLGGTYVTIQGIDSATYTEVVSTVNVVEGGMFTCSDCPEVVVGKGLAEELNISVGSRLALSIGNASREVLVVGVFETGIRLQEMAVYVPLRLVQEMSGLSGYVTSVLVKCVDPSYVDSVANTIRGTIQGVTVVVQRALTNLVEQALSTLNLFFLSIGLVALTAGGFGVMNTMFMAVAERTREIGILKSIGAGDRFIFTLFIAEALIIGAVGSLAGVGVGVLVTQLIPRFAVFGGARLLPGARQFSSVPQNISGLTITPQVVGTAVLIGIAVSVVAGLVPSYRAARIRPAEAIRYV